MEKEECYYCGSEDKRIRDTYDFVYFICKDCYEDWKEDWIEKKKKWEEKNYGI